MHFGSLDIIEGSLEYSNHLNPSLSVGADFDKLNPFFGYIHSIALSTSSEYKALDELMLHKSVSKQYFSSLNNVDPLRRFALQSSSVVNYSYA